MTYALILRGCSTLPVLYRVATENGSTPWYKLKDLHSTIEIRDHNFTIRELMARKNDNNIIVTYLPTWPYDLRTELPELFL